jgi:hypothetical protein
MREAHAAIWAIRLVAGLGSRSDQTTAAVGFSPRIDGRKTNFVAERRLNSPREFPRSGMIRRRDGCAAPLGLIDENALSNKHGAPLELFQPGFEGKHGVRLGLRLRLRGKQDGSGTPDQLPEDKPPAETAVFPAGCEVTRLNSDSGVDAEGVVWASLPACKTSKSAAR